MYHLIIVALGIFTNGTTGETAKAVAVMPSVTACAQMINQNREPRVMDDGSSWYLTDATCKVISE